MAQGIQLFGADGALTYSSSDVTWNQVAFFRVSGGTSVTNSYPIIYGREVLTLQLLINAPPTDRRALAHNVTVSGQDVSVSGGSEDAYISVLFR